MKKVFSVLGIVIVASAFLTGCKLPWEKDTDLPPTTDEEIAPAEDELISFYAEPKKLDYTALFVGDKLTVLDKYWSGGVPTLDGEPSFEEEYMIPKVYELGTFNIGDYADQKFYLVSINCVGPCFITPYYRITVNPDGTWTSFTRYSDTWGEWEIESAGNLFDSFDNLIISQLEYPETITDTATGTVFERTSDDPNIMMAELSKKEIFENPEVGAVYVENDSQCSVAALPDGTAQRYDMVIGFSTGLSNADSYDVQHLGKSAGEIFDVTWTDGTKAEDMYSYKGRYSFGACLYNKADEYYMNDLEQIGTTGKGDAVYGFKSSEHQALDSFYEMAFLSYMVDENGDPVNDKPAYEEFVASHPLFYWEDSYGRLIEFGKSDYQPLAEMGKPVIYLYPEKTSVVNVKVEPTHGISVSDPLYGRNGWDVIAKPSGELFNLTDRKVYPYLFWEGLSLDYMMPEEGFVVAHRDVEKFLNEKLAVLGLNKVETADFMEFWYPKFDSAPYYYITFMPQEDFEKIAPLSVTPSPDTIIRVYMDYAPLAKPIKVTEPKLTTPSRNGFTVVEWGGALQRSFR